MEGPLVPHAAGSSYAPPPVRTTSYSGALLRRFRKATKRKSSAPRPTPPALTVTSTATARQLVASAVTTARVVTKETAPAHAKPLRELDPPSPVSRVSSDEEEEAALPEAPEISMEELQLAEWRHHAQFEFSISARCFDLY